MALFIRPQIPMLISSSHADLKSCTPNLSMTPPNRNPQKYTGCEEDITLSLGQLLKTGVWYTAGFSGLEGSATMR